MSGKNRLFKSGKTIWLRWDFCWSRISAGFGKSAGFQPELEPKSGTALLYSLLCTGTAWFCTTSCYWHGYHWCLKPQQTVLVQVSIDVICLFKLNNMFTSLTSASFIVVSNFCSIEIIHSCYVIFQWIWLTLICAYFLLLCVCKSHYTAVTAFNEYDSIIVTIAALCILIEYICCLMFFWHLVGSLTLENPRLLSLLTLSTEE